MNQKHKLIEKIQGMPWCFYFRIDGISFSFNTSRRRENYHIKAEAFTKLWLRQKQIVKNPRQFVLKGPINNVYASLGRNDIIVPLHDPLI